MSTRKSLMLALAVGVTAIGAAIMGRGELFGLAMVLVGMFIVFVAVKTERLQPTPPVEQAVATQAASGSVGEKAGELSGSEGNSRA